MKYHQYLFSFVETIGVEQRTLAGTLKIAEQRVTQADIDTARRALCKSPNAALLAVSYLGYMTDEEFRGA